MYFKTVCLTTVLWMSPLCGWVDHIHPSTTAVAQPTVPTEKGPYGSKRQTRGITIHRLSIEGAGTIDEVSKPSEHPQHRVSTKRSASRTSSKKTSLKENPQPNGFHSYMAEPGDTLKTISQKFYGSALYFPVILLHNPQIQDFDVEEGVEIKVLQDAVEAIRLFRQHTVVDEGRIFWIYTAQKNDTLEEIGRKFYRTRYQHNSLVNLNPESRIRAGEHIRILLN